jgi:AraC-like DNA-binding protein
MNTATNLNTLSIFIFIGVCQGFILSFFFILKSSSNIKANLYQGLLLLSLALLMLEQFLNLTGYIVKVLAVTNYSEPLNFTLGPLIYLFVKRSTDQSGTKKDWLHFIVFFFYLGYMCFDFIQSSDFKYNSYVNSYHPEWALLKAQTFVSNDPLEIKKWVNLATAVQLIVYISLAMQHLTKILRKSEESIFRTDDELLKPLRNMVFHFIIVIVIFIIVKICFKGDTGDYFIGLYVSIIFLLTTFRVMNDSAYFDRSTSFMDLSIGKYRKSSLTEARKVKILDNIILELKTRHYFSDNLASLSELAKKIGESPHHVSQVINEKLNESFFELLASYRVEEAKRILSDNKNDNMTIEEVSEIVGYNSKTAFNNAFKKLTGKTPSEFRKSINT